MGIAWDLQRQSDVQHHMSKCSFDILILTEEALGWIRLINASDLCSWLLMLHPSKQKPLSLSYILQKLPVAPKNRGL